MLASLPVMTRSTELELAASQVFVRGNADKLSLLDFINTRVEYPTSSVDSSAAQAFADIDRTLRTRSGVTASGSWFPLYALVRDMTTTNSAALTTGRVANVAAPSLLPQSGVISSGATVLSGQNGMTLGLPYVDSLTGGADWNPEGHASVQRDMDFKLALVQPKTIAIQVVVSRRLMMNSQVDLDGLLREEIARRLGAAIDAAAIDGTGGDDPVGLLRHPDLDILEMGANGAAIGWEHLAEIESRVQSRANGSLRRPTWLFGPKLAKKLRTTAKNSANMLHEGGDIFGHPAVCSAAMPEGLTKGASTDCATLLFGDLSEVFVVFWGPAAVDLLVDGYTMAKDGLVRIVARAEVGICARRIGGFAAIKDARTA